MSVHASSLWKERLAIPAYRVGEAASYARISPQTVASWHKKRQEFGERTLSEKDAGKGLSFLQLIEVAVVAEMRRAGVKLGEIKRARDYFARTTGLTHPFAQLKFKTDGADILSEDETLLDARTGEKLLAANHNGQFVWREMLTQKLQEFNYDDTGSVDRWLVAGVDKDIAIDPRIAFGAPQILGVRTKLLATKWSAGDPIDELADDFGLSQEKVIEALIFEGIDPSDPRLARWIN